MATDSQNFEYDRIADRLSGPNPVERAAILALQAGSRVSARDFNCHKSEACLS